VHYLILQLCSLSLTRLEMLVSLMHLGLEVVKIPLDSGQLILSVLQSGAGAVKEIGLKVTAAISPYQLVIQLLDMHLKMGVLLKNLSVALMNVLDGTVLGLHLASVLLQVEALVGASHCDLACRELPTHVAGRKLGVTNSGHALTPHRVSLVPNGEQGDGDAIEDRQVALTELHEGLVGSPL
jgi:hypothetical protein